jgi:hypothetical protein
VEIQRSKGNRQSPHCLCHVQKKKKTSKPTNQLSIQPLNTHTHIYICTYMHTCTHTSTCTHAHPADTNLNLRQWRTGIGHQTNHCLRGRGERGKHHFQLSVWFCGGRWDAERRKEKKVHNPLQRELDYATKRTRNVHTHTHTRAYTCIQRGHK